jgi:hypothetical protein
MPTTAFWAPNQGNVAQIETYTFTAPSSIGNTYTATINGKSVTYSSVAGDTAALAATGLFNLLNVSTGIPAEFTEITFANPSSGVITATAKVPGTPFANVPGTTLGLVLSTGNGLANGITTAHTKANASPSDVNDPQNWLRVTAPAPGVRQLPQNGDDVVVADSNVPMLWNLDQLAAVQFNTYTRWQTMTGAIGLPENNPGGYTEWRATYFRFSGPQGSVPAGGLAMVLGQGSAGSGPGRERYNVGSQPTTLTCLAAGSPLDEWGIRFLGVHTANTFTALGGVSLGIAMLPGEVANLSSSMVGGGATVGIGAGVTWTAASTLTTYGGAVILGAAPATIAGNSGTQFTFATTGLTWPTITTQGGCSLTWLVGGTVTTLTMSTGCLLEKSLDARTLTVTNSTIDGDTCVINDPLNAVVFTNATSVRQQVSAGPFRFTGTRTMKLT